MEPFNVQFFFRDSLDTRKLLSDRRRSTASSKKRCSQKSALFVFSVSGRALAENQFSNLVKQGRRRVPKSRFNSSMLKVFGQLRKLITRKFQELAISINNRSGQALAGNFYESEVGIVGDSVHFRPAALGPLMKPNSSKPLFNQVAKHPQGASLRINR